MGEDEVLAADETPSAGQRDGQGLVLAAREDLDAHDEVPHRFADRDGNLGHRGDGVGRVRGVDVGAVVHIFEQDGVKACVLEDAGFLDGGVGDLGEGLAGSGGAWESQDLDHANQGAGRERGGHGARITAMRGGSDRATQRDSETGGNGAGDWGGVRCGDP